MNFRRGFFRIWIIGSVMFIAAMAFLSYPKVSSEFDKANMDFSKDAVLLVPVDCKEARGTAKVDYSPPDGPWPAYSPQGSQCWYKIDAFRRLFSEYKGMTDDAVSDRLYKRAGIELDPAKPWTTVAWVAGFAFGIPAFVLALGLAVAWALSGFTQREV